MSIYKKGYLVDWQRKTTYTIPKKKETTSQKAIKGNEGEGKGDYAKVSHNMWIVPKDGRNRAIFGRTYRARYCIETTH